VLDAEPIFQSLSSARRRDGVSSSVTGGLPDCLRPSGQLLMHAILHSEPVSVVEDTIFVCRRHLVRKGEYSLRINRRNDLCSVVA